jgi:hypothetical protein
MLLKRNLVIGLSLISLFVSASQSHADVIGTCSCNSDACHGRWELKAANMRSLHDQCIKHAGEHGLLSRVHRRTKQ